MHVLDWLLISQRRSNYLFSTTAKRDWSLIVSGSLRNVRSLSHPLIYKRLTPSKSNYDKRCIPASYDRMQRPLMT